MALEIRQQLKLSQQLVMTPQLQQAIKLLQLSRMELVDTVRQELEENPVLEEGMDVVEEKEAREESDSADSLEAETGASEEIKEVKGETEGLGEIDWQTYLEGYNLSGTTAEYFEEDEDRPSYENLLTKKSTLTDHLMWQLNLSRIDDRERRVAAEIIGNLDEDGYLKATLEEISDITGHTPLEVEKVLNIVQDFDPTGVASRNLQECLLKQVGQLGMEGSLVETVLREHIAELETRKYPAIAKALEVPLDEVLGAAKVISGLDPRPGRPFGQDEVHYIIPDIFVYKISDEYVVVLNDEGLPNLRINSFYRNALSGAANVDEKAGEYIQEKMRGAIWLIKSIHQRQRTIYKVTKSIVKFQREFFDQGHRIPQAPGAAGRGRGYRDARVDHQPGDHQQIRADSPGAFRAEVFFQQRHQYHGGRIDRLGERQEQNQGNHRRRKLPQALFRPEDGRNPPPARHRYRPANRDQIP